MQCRELMEPCLHYPPSNCICRKMNTTDKRSRHVWFRSPQRGCLAPNVQSVSTSCDETTRWRVCWPGFWAVLRETDEWLEVVSVMTTVQSRLDESFNNGRENIKALAVLRLTIPYLHSLPGKHETALKAELTDCFIFAILTSARVAPLGVMYASS